MGDEVEVQYFLGSGRAINIKRKSSAPQPLSPVEGRWRREVLQEAKMKRQSARQEDCDTLGRIGVAGHMLDPAELSAEPSWLERGDLKIEKDSIGWVHHAFSRHCPLCPVAHHRYFYVQDPRLHPHLPWRKRRWIHPRRVKWFALFGPVKRVQWQTRPGTSTDFILGLARRLNSDSTVERNMIASGSDVRLKADSRRACWVLSEDDHTPIDKLHWDCYLAIAKCLLAMPMPAAK
jgi:hypothetical protein